MSPTRPKLVAFLVACLVAFFAWPAVALAATSADGRWHPGIGDPDATGWITVMAYIATAVLAAINARAAQRSGVKPGFWIGLAVLLTLLGINKQLDLQTWFTEVGRDLAFAGGWYEDRRIVQGVFIAVLCMLAALTAGALRHRLARDWHDYRLAFAGVLLLMLFIIVRAATFHHIDRLVRMDVAGLRINVWLEVGAIAVVAAACLQWRRMHRQRVRAFFLRSLRVRRTVR